MEMKNISPIGNSPDSKVVKLPPIGGKKVEWNGDREGKMSQSLNNGVLDDSKEEQKKDSSFLQMVKNETSEDSPRLDGENVSSDVGGNQISSGGDANPQKAFALKTDAGESLGASDNGSTFTGVYRLKDLFLGNFPESVGKAKILLGNSVWDYVLVVNNPDFDEEDQKEVRFDEAEQFYKTCFKAKKHLSAHQQTLGFMNEISAFTESFNELDNLGMGKKFKNGGSLEKTGPEFKKIRNQPKDFLSLCNNAILVKLVSHLTLKVKTLISTNGRYLFFVISADEEDLEMEAERLRYRKELELAVTDVISLMPCDDALRPFYMLKCLNPEIKESFGSIKKLLTNIMALTKNTEKIVYKYEPQGVTLQHWQTYKCFLEHMAAGIPKIEASIQNQHHKMIVFKTLLKKSFYKANFGLKEDEKLKSLWDRLGIKKQFGPYAEYMRNGTSSEMKTLWKSHRIDPSGKRSMFRNIERIRLLTSYIYTQINLNALEEEGVLVAHFPFHSAWKLFGNSEQQLQEIPDEEKLLKVVTVEIKEHDNNLNSLVDLWKTNILNLQIPINRIRNYFGEKIALYFEFLRNFQRSLFIPSLAGFIVFVLQQVYPTSDPVALIANAFYCFFITIYSTVFLEYWKRRESSLAVIWGQTEYEKIEIARPQFKGELRRSPITDDMEEVYYPDHSRYKYFILSGVFSISIILMILTIVAALIVLESKEFLIYNGHDYSRTTCSVINAIQIQIFNIIYSRVVGILTNMENHKTQNRYEESLIIKTFIFQFVNSFNSLFYIAFVRCRTDNLEQQVCVDQLSTQLISIFLVSYAKNLIELGIPCLKTLYKKWRNSTNRVLSMFQPGDLRADIEGQLLQEAYLTFEKDGTIDDYLELAIQFGYINLFSIAFPLSATMLFIGLWLEMAVDRFKITRLVRRSIPMPAKDIGTWINIFSIICTLSILSNTALFCFTFPTFVNWKDAYDNRYLIFVAVSAFLFVFRNQLMNWIPEVQYKYDIILRRHEFIVEKHFRGAPNTKVVEDVEMFDTTLYFSK